jgi:hypothetical protein
MGLLAQQRACEAHTKNNVAGVEHVISRAGKHGAAVRGSMILAVSAGAQRR